MTNVWILPEGSTILAVDGNQLWYANDNGLGTCTPVGHIDGWDDGLGLPNVRIDSAAT